MKKFVFTIVLSLILLPISAKAATTMPAAVDGVITLTENVTLSSPFVVQSGETLTIDLNGHKLTGPTTGYTIDNQGNLTIVDKGATKGQIYSTAASSSCVRNNNTLNIDGVKVNSTKYIAVKNEPNATVTISNSTLYGGYKYRQNGALMNYGHATVNSSEIIATSKGAAVFLGNTDSTTILNDTKLSASLSTSATLYSTTADNVTRKVIMNSGEFTGSGKIILGDNVDKKLGGTIKINYLDKNTFLPFVEKGSTIVLTKSTSSPNNRVIPEGVTLKIPAGITYKVWTASGNGSLKGDIVVEGTLKARTYNETQKTYYAELEQTLKKAKENDKIILRDDITEATISNTKKVELDLNSKTITGDITNEENASLKIYDKSEDKTGKVVGTITNNSELILENGLYTNVPVTGATGTTEYNNAKFEVDVAQESKLPKDMELSKNEDGTYSVVYKKADYTKVDEAIKKANKIDRKKYTSKSLKLLDQAVKNVVRDKDITEQKQVDKMAKDILDAINKLEKKDAIKNPQTLDKSGIYTVVSLMSLLGLAITYRKICRVG